MNTREQRRRRIAALGGALGLASFCGCGISGLAFAGTFLNLSRGGCCLTIEEGGEVAATGLMLPESGIPRVDDAVAAELTSLKTLFGVDADFKFLNDRSGANAYAIRGDMTHPPVVAFGIRLLHKLVNSLDPLGDEPIPKSFPSPMAGSVAGIMAHEWAHILQFRQRAFSVALTIKPIELHADYMAGWYMGRKNLSVAIERGELEREFRALGDNDFTSYNHHGTPVERAEALYDGFFAAGTDSSAETVFSKGARKYGLSIG